MVSSAFGTSESYSPPRGIVYRMLDVSSRPASDEDLARYAEFHADRNPSFLGLLGCAFVFALAVAVLVAAIAWLGGLVVVWLKPGTTLGIIPPVIGLVAGAIMFLVWLVLGYTVTREPRADWTDKPPRDVVDLHALADAAWYVDGDDLPSMIVFRADDRIVLADASAFDGFGDDGYQPGSVPDIGSSIHIQWMGVGTMRSTLVAEASGPLIPLTILKEPAPAIDWLLRQDAGVLPIDDLPRELRDAFSA